MKRLSSAAMPLPIGLALVASVVALGALWVAPVVGLALFGLVVLAGIVLLVRGSRAAGVVVVVMPFAVFLLVTEVAGELLFKPYRVPSESMRPTIDVGGRILADRNDHSPSLGDVVIAHPPVGALDGRCGAPAAEQSPCARAMPGLSSVNFIKRVVADTIAFRDGLVVRNGRPISEPYAERCTDDACELRRPITVPDGTWFLAGDNRGASDDSRFWGPVPTSAIVGTVRLRYWPLGRLGTL